MGVSLKPLDQQTIVITGASSGIGLATALAAAERGARVVLMSRNAESLAEIERRIGAMGGQATHVVGDVSRREDIERASRAAIDRFGGFDTWVNNAGLSIWGRMEQVSDEDHQRLFQVNFWGVVYGSLVAAEHLKHRGGAIVNLGSLASDMALPLQGMYCASKHAIKGFTDALRVELEEAGSPISVTLIKPTSINTPFPEHAKNYMEKEPKLPDPVYPPQEVANAILHAAVHPTRDIYVGGTSKLLSTLNKHMPRAIDWLNETMMVSQQQRDEPATERRGALRSAGRDGRVDGDHPGYVTKTSLYTRASLHPVLTSALMVAAGAAAATLLSERPKRGWEQAAEPLRRRMGRW